MLDHALSVWIKKVDLMLVNSFSHTASTTEKWTIRITVLCCSKWGLNSFINCWILLVKWVVLWDSLQSRGSFASIIYTALGAVWIDIWKLTNHRVFKFALHIETEIGTQLRFVHDIFKQWGGFLVIVRTAHDLADLGQGQAFAGCLLKEKGRDFYVF